MMTKCGHVRCCEYFPDALWVACSQKLCIRNKTVWSRSWFRLKYKSSRQFHHFFSWLPGLRVPSEERWKHARCKQEMYFHLKYSSYSSCPRTNSLHICDCFTLWPWNLVLILSIRTYTKHESHSQLSLTLQPNLLTVFRPPVMQLWRPLGGNDLQMFSRD